MKKMRVYLPLGSLVAAGLFGVAAAPPAAAADTVELPQLVPAQYSLQQTVDAWKVGDLRFVNEWGTYGLDADGPEDDLRRPASTTGLAAKTVGKLFMVQKNLSTNALTRSSCSGNVVESANRSVVLTAGHCMKVQSAPFQPIISTINAVFIPAFDGTKLDGKADNAPITSDIAPYGVWAVTQAFVTNTWNTSPYFVFGQDMAALVVDSPTTTQPIQDVTGGQPTDFTRPRPTGDQVRVFGYPQDNSRYWHFGGNNGGPRPSCDSSPAPANRNNQIPQAQWRISDGDKPYYSVGTVSTGSVYMDNNIPSALSASSSGGPWFEDFDPATGVGVQTSVTSRNDDPANGSPLVGWLQGPNIVGTYFDVQPAATMAAAEAVPTPNLSLTNGPVQTPPKAPGEGDPGVNICEFDVIPPEYQSAE